MPQSKSSEICRSYQLHIESNYFFAVAFGVYSVLLQDYFYNGYHRNSGQIGCNDASNLKGTKHNLDPWLNHFLSGY